MVEHRSAESEGLRFDPHGDSEKKLTDDCFLLKRGRNRARDKERDRGRKGDQR